MTNYDSIKELKLNLEYRMEELEKDFGKNMTLIVDSVEFLAKEIDFSLLTRVSTNKAHSVRILINELENSLKKIVNYDPRASNETKNEPKNLISHLIPRFDNAVDAWSTVAYLTQDDSETDRKIKEADVALTIDRIRNVEEEAKEILSALKGSSAQRGVDISSEEFSEQAEKYLKQSNSWLWVSLGVSVLGIGIVIALMIWLPLADTELKSIINYLGSKLFVISILYIAVAFSIKNYSAAKHNEALNTHRHNALSVYERLVAGALDPQTKDAVLRQATEAIFSMQKTGYISKESDGGGISKITEVVNSATNNRPS